MSKLMDSIQIFSLDQVRFSINKQIMDYVDENRGERIAIYPVFGKDDIKESVSNDENKVAINLNKHRAFIDFEPRNIINTEPGSEALVSLFITDLHSTKLGKKVFNQPDFEELKKNKIDTIIFINDISYTGNQIVDYIKSFYRNPSIKSWISYGKIKLISLTAYSTVLSDHLVSKMNFISKNLSSEEKLITVYNGGFEKKKLIPLLKYVKSILRILNGSLVIKSQCVFQL